MNLRFYSRLSSPGGLTLLEVSVALAISGIVIGALWMVVSTTLFNQGVAKLEQGIINTSSRIREYFRDRPISVDAGAVTNVNMLGLNLVAPELIVNGGIGYNLAVGGTNAITITYNNALCNPAGLASLSNNFLMTLFAVRDDACQTLLPDLIGSRAQIESRGIIRTMVSNQNVITTAVAGGVTTYDFNQATAIKDCNLTPATGVTIQICFLQN